MGHSIDIALTFAWADTHDTCDTRINYAALSLGAPTLHDSITGVGSKGYAVAYSRVRWLARRQHGQLNWSSATRDSKTIGCHKCTTICRVSSRIYIVVNYIYSCHKLCMRSWMIDQRLSRIACGNWSTYCTYGSIIYTMSTSGSDLFAPLPRPGVVLSLSCAFSSLPFEHNWPDLNLWLLDHWFNWFNWIKPALKCVNWIMSLCWYW